MGNLPKAMGAGLFAAFDTVNENASLSAETTFMSRENPPVAFWRCRKCGTPNPGAGYLTNCLGCGRPLHSEKPAKRSRTEISPKPTQVAEIARSPRRVLLDWVVLGLCWAFAAMVAVLVVLIRLTSDRWWPTTFVLFGPRWVLILPMLVLVPLALLARRRSTVWPLLLALGLFVGPWMGLCLPWNTFPAGRPKGLFKVRILTCNVEGGKATRLWTLIESDAPDIVVMQELPSDKGWTATLFPEPNWHFRNMGGVGVASRFPIVDVEAHPLANPEWAGGFIGRFELSTPVGHLNVFGVHLETPREGLEAVIHDKWSGIPDLKANLVQRLKEANDASEWAAKSSAPYLIAGDFNMPADSTIYRECWSNFPNVFSGAGVGFGHSKFTRWFGIRIDHILTGPGWQPQRCRVAPDVGSDHRPVIADVEWAPPLD